MNQSSNKTINRIPVLPIRDKVIFPGVQVSLVVGRDRSIQAVKEAMNGDRRIFIVSQRHLKVEDPKADDLFSVGVMAEIIQSVTLPDGLLSVRVTGLDRAKLVELAPMPTHLLGEIQILESVISTHTDPLELETMRRMVVRLFEDYAKRTGRIPLDVLGELPHLTSIDVISNTVSEYLMIGVEEKQDLIEVLDLYKRLNRLVEILNSEIEILQIEKRIQTRVNKQIEKNQKEYYLNEQMRAIQKELKKKDDLGQEVEQFKQKIADAKMTPEAEEVALKELSRLEKMMTYTPEATVVRSYLEWLVALPWSQVTKDVLDVNQAKAILDEDHFGLEKPKERILEYMAVLKLTENIKGPILCFVGPPGVGKTSLAKSMARAMGRKFVRISLGGVRDESEIRGHRRTYIGSMPGRLIQALKKTKSKNPIILLDEIDKMGNDWRGDPAAALLEVLDPEQNKTFVDHFLDVGFDLSQIIFIATANSLYSIPATLQDRMEVIRYSAYTTEEKVSIVNRFLLPKELKEHGLSAASVKIDDEAIRKIIHLYTREAGVRELQRKIAKICRKVAVDLVQNGKSASKGASVVIRLVDLNHYLGVPEFIREKISVNSIGVVTGLAWTDHGGETLTIEVTTMPGQGKITLTGKLGSVMQESAQAAFSLIKSRAKELQLRENKLRKLDLHIHVPEGAVPKDGPSAGVAMATAIASALMGKPVIKDLAMTGEVTLRGRVLPIGGLKEKVLAAFREGIQVVLYPVGNEKDLSDIPADVQKKIKLIPVQSIEEVLKVALQSAPPSSTMVSRKSTPLPRTH